MNRYQNNTLITSSFYPRYLATTRYPDVPLYDNDSYIITQYGDRLDNIAYQFYGDPTLWWVLSIANPDLPKDSLYPSLGYQLRIPTLPQDVIRDFNSINS